MQGRAGQRGARAVALRRQRPDPAPWWMWAALAAGLLLSAPAWSQVTPSPQPIPPGGPIAPGTGGGDATDPPGDTSPGLAPGEGAPGSGVPNSSGLPGSGVLTPPPLGNTGPVIRPPVAGTMPVIPPPGSPGGNRSVVPK